MGDSHGCTDDTRSHPLTSVIKFGGPSRKKQTIFLFADKKKISILQQISTITSVFLSLFELFVKRLWILNLHYIDHSVTLMRRPKIL